MQNTTFNLEMEFVSIVKTNSGRGPRLAWIARSKAAEEVLPD